MSGVRGQLRAQHRRKVQPLDHQTKADRADAARACALSILNFRPAMDRDAVDNANALLEMVGEMLTLPRAGWYPRRPKGWRA